jgi:sugar (pentulose or hexulose) kinase
MTSAVLDLLQSRGPVLIDGGLLANAAYIGLLAGLRPAQSIMLNPMAQGTATGAAMLAYDTLDIHPPVSPGQPVEPWSLPGLSAYFLHWKSLSEANREVPFIPSHGPAIRSSGSAAPGSGT